MSAVLFVDDEPRILDALGRALRRHRDRWSWHFAVGGTAALDVMAKAPIDVVVTDMRMPMMDGVALLEEVRRRSPGTARVVLSGHTEFEATLRAVQLAHQFLSKPCETSSLLEILERLDQVRGSVSDDAVRARVGAVDAIRPRRSTLVRARAALGEAGGALERLAPIVEEDAGLCLRLLQVANSAFFGRTRATASVPEALDQLGPANVEALIGSGALGEAREEQTALDRRSARAARLARRFLGDTPLADAAASAGLLADVGSLVGFDGESHAIGGYYLASLLGLPPLVAEAIRAHHEPTRHAAVEAVTAAVHLATHAVEHRLDALDTPYLDALGVERSAAGWAALAEALGREEVSS